jgi:pyruvate/2-oxoglutarate dehydrogenase complex dihydrolipoamide dehydrogenase (E3) component
MAFADASQSPTSTARPADGGVIGAPARAATGMEQVRAAMNRALGSDLKRDVATLLPTGIYTIPEIGSIGATEERLASTIRHLGTFVNTRPTMR